MSRYPTVRADDRLTYRQREVVRLIALGQTTANIAHELGITRSTVYRHRGAALAVFGAGCAMDLFRAMGWLQVPA